jgi:glycosyltransferase involved in cell wall biosynthesis
VIITIRSYLSSHTGYGHIAEHLGIALEQLGHDVRLDDYGEQECYGPLSAWTQAHRVKQGAGVVLNVNIPNQPSPLNLPSVLLTMWESTKLPDNTESNYFTAPFLNRGRAVVVPCRWNAENFAREGVTVPIYVVPFGVSDCYRPAPMAMDGPTRFGFAARVSHGPPRKRVNEAIRAFSAAFPRGDEDVRLYLKVGPPCLQHIEGIEDERIRVSTKALSEDEMARWYKRMTVGFLPSSGEGYGLHGAQFQACGRPIIACRYGGRAEYFDASCGWEIEYDEVPATGVVYDGLGMWAMPRHESMVECLRMAHTHRLLAAIKGRDAAMRVSEFTWERSARMLVPILEEAA